MIGVRPYRYEKRKQAVIDRIEKGLQSKAAKAKKPHKETQKAKQYENYIKQLRDEKGLSFVKIRDILKKEFNIEVSDTTVKRIYYGKRSNWKKSEKQAN
ncbi:hypothetical protein [Deferribacter abyssi]|uniref:hypothetical protein n=1 Tax=Deferribacter abyssi TaxID=213806 RepID=UPI003C225423